MYRRSAVLLAVTAIVAFFTMTCGVDAFSTLSSQVRSSGSRKSATGTPEVLFDCNSLEQQPEQPLQQQQVVEFVDPIHVLNKKDSVKTGNEVNDESSSGTSMGHLVTRTHTGWEEALAQKNAARTKFGLKPLTVHDFVQLQEEVQKLEAERRAIMAQTAAAARAEQQQQQQRGRNLLENLFTTVLKDTCESNFDCERPETCCNLGFKKMCCRSGSFVRNSNSNNNGLQYALVPVPVGVQDHL